MKRLIYAAAAALLVGAAACSHSDDASQPKFFSTQASDSLLLSLGRAAGAELNANISQRMATDSVLTKEQFIRGLQYGLAADTTGLYIDGVVVGLQLQRQLNYYRQMGIPVNPAMAIDAFKKVFMDSMPDQVMAMAYQAQYHRWNDSLMTAKREYDRAIRESSPEAKSNLEKGLSYIKAKKVDNDSVQIAPSGLGYKIIDPGKGEKMDVQRPVKVKFTATTLGGKEVSRAVGQPVNLNRYPEGLREGISMLGEGGKAVFYVPGNLGYGVDVPQGFDLGPNELLIYTVETVEQGNYPGR